MIKTNSEKLKSALADDVRRQRDALLADCDWTMVPDSTADKQAWGAYRQALRDISQQKGFPLKITWPPVPPQ